MTERSEITTVLQKELSQIPAVFGSLRQGTAETPAITKESVHHYFKYVSGAPLIRPAWFFDTDQQGEGIADVTTHLVDLTFWECFPETAINDADLQLDAAERWPTVISKEAFYKVTGTNSIPDYLQKTCWKTACIFLPTEAFTIASKDIMPRFLFAGITKPQQVQEIRTSR